MSDTPGTPAEGRDLVVIDALNDWTCTICGQPGDLMFMEDGGPLCMTCADLDHLVYLARGNTALTRRARQSSGLSAVVVRFSRTPASDTSVRRSWSNRRPSKPQRRPVWPTPKAGPAGGPGTRSTVPAPTPDSRPHSPGRSSSCFLPAPRSGPPRSRRMPPAEAAGGWAGRAGPEPRERAGDAGGGGRGATRRHRLRQPPHGGG